MFTCKSIPLAFSLLSPMTKGVGRRFVMAKVGLTLETRKPDDIQWCDECGRYYNPKSEHECNMKAVNENRRSLERWLGSFKIREDE